MMRKSSIIFFLGLIGLLAVPEYLPAQQSNHTVEKGETLFSIASKYGLELEQLKKWNDLNGANLSVGQTLVIEKQEDADVGPLNEKKKHTVTKGETLFSLSKKYKVSIARLKSWNNLSSNNVRLGQTLLLHPPEAVTEQTQPKTAESSTEPRQSNYYTVKNGDSLYGIAHKHDMDVDVLKKLNNLSSNNIRVGRKLAVRSTTSATPVNKKTASAAQGKFMKYTVTGGNMTVAELVKKFQMDEEEFRALNPDAGSSTMQNGGEVTVLAPPSKTFNNPYAKTSRSMNKLGSVTVSEYTDKAKASPTTSGELYNPEALTGAHPNIALGSVIYVKSPVFPYGVFVRINDRVSGNELKLSTAAWKALHLSESNAEATIYKSK